MTRQDLLKLSDKLNDILAKARANMDKADRTSTDEEEYERLMAEYDKLNLQIEREQRLLDAQAAADERHGELSSEPAPAQNSGDLDRRPHNVEQAELDREILHGEDATLTPQQRFFLAAMASPRSRERMLRTDEERANFAIWQRAALSSIDGTTGGHLVPEGFMPELVRLMKAWGPLSDPGVIFELNTESGNPLPWPVVDDTNNEGEAIAESAAAEDSDLPAFQQVIFNAHKYTTGVLLIPTELIEDAFFVGNGLMTLLADLLGERMARIRNRMLTVGTGNNEPNGIVTSAPLGLTTASNAGPSGDELIDIQHSIDPAYRQNQSRLGWMFNDDTLKYVRKLKDGDGNYLWQGKDLRSGKPDVLLGDQYWINQAMDSFGADSKFPIVYGNMMKYVCRKIRSYRIKVLMERYAERDQVGYIGWQRFDGDIIDRRAIRKVASSA